MCKKGRCNWIYNEYVSYLDTRYPEEKRGTFINRLCVNCGEQQTEW